MKKIGLMLGLILLLGACQKQNKLTSPALLSQPTTAEVSSDKQLVTLVIDTGEEMATYSAKVSEATTVLALLTKIGEEKALEVETKVYSFGTLVEAIQGRKNTADKAWIYFVNGQTGEIGAGEKQLKAGDLVEWKYIPPIY